MQVDREWVCGRCAVALTQRITTKNHHKDNDVFSSYNNLGGQFDFFSCGVSHIGWWGRYAFVTHKPYYLWTVVLHEI